MKRYTWSVIFNVVGMKDGSSSSIMNFEFNVLATDCEEAVAKARKFDSGNIELGDIISVERGIKIDE